MSKMKAAACLGGEASAVVHGDGEVDQATHAQPTDCHSFQTWPASYADIWQKTPIEGEGVGVRGLPAYDGSRERELYSQAIKQSSHLYPPENK